MTEMMGNPDKSTVARACKHLMSRIEALVEADGNFIDYNDSPHVFLS